MEFLGRSSTSSGRGGVSSRFGRSRLDPTRQRHQRVFDTESELMQNYPHELNFYLTPPPYSISLQEFEKFAVERLKLLRLIERINVTAETKFTPGYYEEIWKAVKQNEFPTYYILFGNADKFSDDEIFQARKDDHISHFLLRLAFARSDDLRKWFIQIEVDLFRTRLYIARLITFDLMIKEHELPFVKANAQEIEKFRDDIYNATFTTGNLPSEVYKVHFTQALDLVRSRNVFLRDGFAFVPYNELSTVICLKFRSYLSESLSVIKKNIHLVEDDERLRPLISGFEKRYLGNESSVAKTGDAVTLAELSIYAEKSFPLCMKHVYDVVQKEHHLKHWGRLQLGLFFKGLGVQLDEATKFWRTNFTKRPEIDTSRFDKQYLYNIRHMYGQEGKRTDYTPYSCMKIINTSVGPGDHHGCPFKHSDATPLRVKLVDAGVPQEGIKEIMTLVENKHYQIACQRYFELTHDKQTVDGGVNHPNQYFMESRNVLTGKKTIKTEGKGDAPKVTMYFENGDKSTQGQKSEPTEPMDEANINAAFDVDDEIFSQMEY